MAFHDKCPPCPDWADPVTWEVSWYALSNLTPEQLGRLAAQHSPDHLYGRQPRTPNRPRVRRGPPHALAPNGTIELEGLPMRLEDIVKDLSKPRDVWDDVAVGLQSLAARDVTPGETWAWTYHHSPGWNQRVILFLEGHPR